MSLLGGGRRCLWWLWVVRVGRVAWVMLLAQTVHLILERRGLREAEEVQSRSVEVVCNVWVGLGSLLV
jgi:hypothetical protein